MWAEARWPSEYDLSTHRSLMFIPKCSAKMKTEAVGCERHVTPFRLHELWTDCDVPLQWWRKQDFPFYQTTRYYELWRHSGVSWTLWSSLSRHDLSALCNLPQFHCEQPPPPCTRISSQSQQKLAARSCRLCVAVLSRLFFISVIISFLLISYISVFSLFLFVSATFCNSLPWLI
jgi:hypothetical protein